MLKRTTRLSALLLALVMVLSVVMAVPRLTYAADGAYTDVGDGHTFKNYIGYVSEKGAFEGDGGKFMPEASIKRGQVAAVLARALDLELDAVSDFPDVPEDHIFTKDIAAVTAEEIFGGYADGKFRPEAFITRGQAAKVIANAYDYELIPGKALKFDDVKEGDEFKDYIDILTSNGVLSGDGNLFNPDGEVTRGQFAKYLAAPMGYVEVVSVISINETEVKVKFNQAAPEDNLAMAVVVKDGAGNVVATETTVVFEGDKEATFTFDPAVAEAKLVGVWTVDGVEYSFDALSQFDAIMAEVREEFPNPYIFQELLDEAGITYADETKAGLEVYICLLLELDATAVEDILDRLGLENDFKLTTLADIQTAINALDQAVVDSAADVAKILAVAKAKTPTQLLAALIANFEMVNPEWKAAYANEYPFGASDIDDIIEALEKDPINPEASLYATWGVDEIQEIIYDVNYCQIKDVEGDADSAADFAAVIVLVGKWLPADYDDEDFIADWKQDLKVAVAEFKVAEATTPNNLYNALVNYANVAADEDDDDILLLSELNDKLKAFYYEVFEGLEDHPYYDDYVKYSIVEPADEAALKAAMAEIETAYEAINAAENEEEDSTTAAQKTALKTALQKLADYTSHLKGDEMFEMSIVIDANLVAYAEEFAKADAIVETSDVIDVINKVNDVNDEVEEAILFKALNDATTAVQVNAALLGLENETYINIPSADRLFVAEALLEANEHKDLDEATIDGALDAAILVHTNALAGVNNLTSAALTTDVVDALEEIDAAYAEKGLVEKSAIAETFFNGLVFEGGALKTPFTTIAAIKTAAGL